MQIQIKVTEIVDEEKLYNIAFEKIFLSKFSEI